MTNYRAFDCMEAFFLQTNRKADIVLFEDVCQLPSHSNTLAHMEAKETISSALPGISESMQCH